MFWGFTYYSGMRTCIQNALVICWDCVIVYQSRDHCSFLFNLRELLVEESELQRLLKSRRVRSETVAACQWLLPPLWPVPSLLRQPTGRYFIDNIVFYDLAGSEGRPLRNGWFCRMFDCQFSLSHRGGVTSVACSGGIWQLTVWFWECQSIYRQMATLWCFLDTYE